MKSGDLNFLEPSGPLQACNGTALLLVANVEECTRAETGVGAAIFVGKQEENGIWALLGIEFKIARKGIGSNSIQPDRNRK